MLICKLNQEAGDHVSNLMICKVEVKRLSPEEQLERNAQNRAKWRKKEWNCPDCGLKTTNNAKWIHRRYCKSSNFSFTEEQIQNIKQADKVWRNKPFNCSICGNSYKNGYRKTHTLLCEMKHRKMD